mgnify:FL=1
MMNENPDSARGISRRTKKIIFIAGLAVYIIGLYLLTFVNSMADNWAGTVSPICIIGGLITLFVSLLLKTESGENPGADT